MVMVMVMVNEVVVLVRHYKTRFATSPFLFVKQLISRYGYGYGYGYGYSYSYSYGLGLCLCL